MAKKQTFNYYYVKCGKNKLVKEYGWHLDFQNRFEDFKGNQIHYEDLKKKEYAHLKDSFKNAKLSAFKVVKLPLESGLCKNVIEILNSKKFQRFNNKVIKELTKKINTEFKQIKELVKEEKVNYGKKGEKHEFALRWGTIENIEKTKPVFEESEEGAQLKTEFRKYLSYLINKEILEKTHYSKKEYLTYCLENCYKDGQYFKYNEEGKTIIEEKDYEDIQTRELKVDFEGKFARIVFIRNPLLMHEYCNVNLLDKEGILNGEKEILEIKEITPEIASAFKIDKKKGIVDDNNTQDKISEAVAKMNDEAAFEEIDNANRDEDEGRYNA